MPTINRVTSARSLRRIFFVALIAHNAQLSAAEPNLLLGAGAVNVLDKNPAAWGAIEYRPGVRFHGIGSWIGLEGSERQQFAGIGALFDIPLGARWFVTPSFGPGVYFKSHDGVDLGSPIEFRSTLEVSFRLKNNSRIGASFGHISNGNLSGNNPGTEVAKLFYQMLL